VSLSATDTWLHHVINSAEVCPDKANICGIWHYALTRSIKKTGKVEISGRVLELINDGIARHAEAIADRLGAAFRGIVFETIEAIDRGIGQEYAVIPDPTDDPAHAYLDHPRYNEQSAEDFLISREVLRLHDTFTFAAPASRELEGLEVRAGSAA
jgi:hypothetical protein